jgi:nucleoside-diphosphate-sugar epimerase
MFKRFGLLATLRKDLPDSSVFKLLSLMVSSIPAPKLWCRQYVHEDDVCNIVERLVFTDIPGNYEIFNLAPPGPVVKAQDMAQIVGRKTYLVSPLLVRVAFFWMRHLTLGKIITSKGGWRFYSYPIVLDGRKVTEKLGYEYTYSSIAALEKLEGRYLSALPKEVLAPHHVARESSIEQN